MRALRPATGEERRLLLLVRARRWLRSKAITRPEMDAIEREMAVDWRTSAFFSRIAFFVLAVIAVGAFYGILDIADAPLKGWLAGVSACIIAELLIVKKRFLRTGIEEGLYLSGLFAIIFGLPGPPRDEGLLLFALAAAFTGWRLLNGWFLAAGVALVTVYIHARFDALAAGTAAIALASIAALLSLRTVRRPWIDSSIAAIAVAFPFLAWLHFERLGYESEIFGDIRDPEIVIPLLAFAGLVAAIAGIRFRHRPPLLGSLISFALCGLEVSALMPWRPELKSLIAGLSLLVAAAWLDHRLRPPRAGITSRKLFEPEHGWLEIASIPAIAPAVAQTPSREGGGQFGGGGASG